ncbi:hypothetical protein E3N88_30692 [Mikania micrantha]|uniref:Uncharacterized protein n=1 Tax=Mikania micrantha TaxID=192012 RepID=A0A5N6MMY6_9ASTR|nr:hypothetical protein E3N88_30692 [Mikania micrantha]
MADETLLNNLIDSLKALLVLNDQMQHNLKRISDNLDKQSTLFLQLQDVTGDALPLCDERRFTCSPIDDSDLGLPTTVPPNSGSIESKHEVITYLSNVVQSPLYPTLMPSLGDVDATSIGLICDPVTSLETIYLARCHEQHDRFNHRFDSPTSLAPKLNVVLAPNVIAPFPSIVTEPTIFVSYSTHIVNDVLTLGHNPIIVVVIKLAGDCFRRKLVVYIVTYDAILIACCQSGSTLKPFTLYKTNDTSTKLFQWIDTGWVVTPLVVQVSVWHKWKTKLASTTKQFSWTFLLAANCILSFFMSAHLNHFFIALIIPIAEKSSMAPRHEESPLHILLREELATYGRSNTHAVLKNQVPISIVARVTSILQVNVHRAATFSSVLGYLAYFAPLNQGLQIHTHVFKQGMGFSLSVRILLVSFYAKLGCVHDPNMIFDSYIIFDSFHRSNVVSYTFMINEFLQKGFKKEAFTLFVKMDTSSFGYLEAEHLGNHFICHGLDKNAWIPHSISLHVDDTRQLYGFLATKEALEIFHDFKKCNVITNDRHLVEFYLHVVMLSILDCCRQLFNSMLVDNGIEPLIQHYGCIVGLLSRGQMVLETVNLLYKIPRNVDLKILGALLKGCGSLGIIVVEKNPLKMLITGALQCAIPINPIVLTVLLRKYVKCGTITVAFKVFNSVQTNGNLAWNTMLMGLRMHGHDNNAPLDEHGVPKWDFLKQFHKAIQLYAVFLVATDPPTTFLGQNLKARVYKTSSTCASFLEPGITTFVVLYGHRPPNIACYFHHSPGHATTWKDIFGLHGLLDLHLEDKVNFINRDRDSNGDKK